mgnify:CR=1 FL=1
MKPTGTRWRKNSRFISGSTLTVFTGGGRVFYLINYGESFPVLLLWEYSLVCLYRLVLFLPSWASSYDGSGECCGQKRVGEVRGAEVNERK